MPAKKQTKTTETVAKTRATKKTAASAPEPEPVQVAPVVVEETHVETETTQKPERRAGRTLLIKSASPLADSVFSGLTGLVSRTETKASGSMFLTFDTVDNSLTAFKSLRSIADCRVKFSYYRVFFTMNGLTDSTDYNQTKQVLMSYVSDKTGTLVLYCKFYRKDNKFLGCGDFTIDTLDGMNKLLSKEGGLKEYSFGAFSGTFYRFNNRSFEHKAQMKA